VLVAVAIVTAADCGKKSEQRQRAPDDAAPPAGALLLQEWQARIDDENARSYARPPLFEPAVPGESAEDYLPAVAFDPSFEVYEAAVEVLDGRLPWKKAPEALQTFAASDEARAAVEGILRGASRTHGKSVAPMRSDVMNAIVGSPNEVVRIVAFADAQAGQPYRACRYLLAQQRFLQDLARGSPLAASLVARTYQLGSLRLLRRIVAGGKLSDDELREIVAAYGRLLLTRVPIEDALRVELLFLAAEEIRRPLLPGEPEASRTAALKRLEAQLAVVERLKALPARGLAKHTSFFEREICRVDDTAETCKSMSRYLAQLTLAEAHFLATYVYLALALDRRTRGAPAPDLSSLTPDTVPSVPDDPVTGEPFEYISVDGTRVIRRGATALDAAPDAEPRDIAVP